MIKLMLLAGLGGFFGTCARYLTGQIAHHVFHTHFPMGTMIVNVVGCFIIGLLFGLSEKQHLLSNAWSAILITGFCGGFTTFSTFSDDAWQMLQHRSWTPLLLYVGGSIVLGILMVWAGRHLIKEGLPS